MTSLIAWQGVDSRGPASFYLASDSRISWNSSAKWDRGRKVFATRASPDLFGYCGDVLFPSLFLGQFTALSDTGSLFPPNAGPGERHAAFLASATSTFLQMPEAQQRAFTLLHCGRLGSGMSSSYHLWRIDWTPSAGLVDRPIQLPGHSAVVCALGSGERVVIEHNRRWQKTEVGRTSRAVFSAFCDALRSGDDPYSGGAPQLVGLYRQGEGEVFGVISGRQRHLLGLPLESSMTLDAVEWRNELFERCDPNTLTRLEGAQRHPRPKGHAGDQQT
jgi:hypothetical protein